MTLVMEDLFKSRLASVGVDGTKFTRVFLVEDPTDVDGNPCDAVFDLELREEAAIGSTVDQLPGAVAVEYAKTEVHSPTQFTVEVTYESPTIAASTGWTMEVDSQPWSEHVKTVPLTVQERSERNPAVTPTIVGPFAYKRRDSLIGQLQSDEKEFMAGDTLLYLPRNAKRIPVGMDVDRTVLAISARKRFDDANPWRLIKLMSYFEAVNDQSMLLASRRFFRRGQLKLDSVHISDVRRDDGGIGEDITVGFSAKPDGWQFESVHEYTDPDSLGSESQVVMTEPAEGSTAGEPVVETFRRQFFAPMNGLLESL